MSGSDGGGGGGGDVFDDSSDGGLGFESSGLDSDEEEFVGCDSRSASGGESGGEEDGSDADERDDAPAATEAEAGDTSDDESVIQCAFQILDKLTTAEETLTCDGGCQREMPPSERRYSCTEEDCDFDICTGCAGRRRQLPVAIRAAPADPPRAQPAAAVPRPAPPPAAPRSSAAAQAARPDGIAALVRDAAARAEAARAARAAHGNGEQRRRMDSYHQWQHERAAERERAAAAQRERAAEAASGSAGEEPIATAASAAGASAATADAAASAAVPPLAATPTTDYTLRAPPPLPIQLAADGAAMREQVAELINGGAESQRRLAAFVREAARQLEGVGVADGEAPTGPPVERTARGAPTRAPTRFQVQLPSRPPTLPLASLTFRRRCPHCDDEVGGGQAGGACAGLQFLETLSEELEAQDGVVERGLEDGGEVKPLHRASRKHMYRTYVGAKYGHLGQGNRVQIPICVVCAIRSCYATTPSATASQTRSRRGVPTTWDTRRSSVLQWAAKDTVNRFRLDLYLKVKSMYVAAHGTEHRSPSHVGLWWAHVGLRWAHVGLRWAHVGLRRAHVGLRWAHVGLRRAHMGLRRAHVWGSYLRNIMIFQQEYRNMI